MKEILNTFLGTTLGTEKKGEKEEFSKISIEILDPIPLEEIPDGAPCPWCQCPVHKTYIAWNITPALDDRKKLTLTVHNTPGYRCSGCSEEWPTHIGLLQCGQQALPVFHEKGCKRTVEAILWTEQILLEIILPRQQPMRK